MTIDLLKPSRKPFRFKGEKIQALYLHGYTGSPYDLKTLANYLKNHGIGGYAPLLSGHKENPLKLNLVTYKDWLKDSKKAFLTLDKDKPKIIVGLSMGGLLASILAADFKHEVKALILLSPSLKLKNYMQLLVNALSLTEAYRFIPSLPKEDGKSDIADENARNLCPSFKEIPLKGLKEVLILQEKTMMAIPQISCPIFIGLGHHDHTIDIMDSSAPYSNFGGPLIVIKEYQSSQHVLPLDLDRERLFKDILDFLAEIGQKNDQS